MHRTKKILLTITAAALLIVLCFSGVQIWKICREYAQEERQHQQLLVYKPADPAPDSLPISEPENTLPAETERIINQSILDLQSVYPDTVGWLTVDGTEIDYPFVQAEDNQKYLRHDMDLNYLVSGTVFMDYRNASDFSDFATILYGHQMKNDSMFGTMDRFREDAFFLGNSTGRIYLPYETLELEVVAVIVVRSDDKEIYDLDINADAEKQAFITYVQENAEQLRAGIELTVQDRFVILSTCVYDFTNARMALITRIVNEQADRK